MGRTKVSVDVAMYSFTDRELAEELGRLARRGLRVSVYRDSAQYEQESQHGLSTTEILLAAGVQVKVNASRDLMHLKSYAVDGALLRTGSANWSPTGLKRQDNDLRYEADAALASNSKLTSARCGTGLATPCRLSPDKAQKRDPQLVFVCSPFLLLYCCSWATWHERRQGKSRRASILGSRPLWSLRPPSS